MASPRKLTFKAWLRQLQAQRREGGARPLVVGSTGHLLLSDAETAAAAAQITQRVLPEIAQRSAGRGVTLLMGSAPGADVLFNTLALDTFARHGIACTSVALLPVPPWWLIFDFMLRARSSGSDLSADALARGESAVTALLARADLQVPLYAPGTSAQHRLPEWRTAQYRQLAACLAEQADLLVAILRPQHAGEPGGTAEVVDWRRDPARIPAPLRTGAAPDAARHLIVLDPAATDAAPARPGTDASLQLAQDAMRSGNDLRAYDLLFRARKGGLRSRRMDYLLILSMANVGNTSLALAEYRALQLGEHELSEDWLALRGRLEKDLALAAAPGAAATHFRRAADAYMSAFRLCKGYFSGINAATMLAMAGDREPARALATQVLALLDALPDDTPEPAERYYRLATAAEAALHLGDAARCEAQLRAADALLPGDVVRRGRTLRQLQQLCRQLGASPAPLAALRMPPVVLLQGEHGDDAAPAPVRLPALPESALVFMSLIGPTDLALATALLAAGSQVYPTLPQAVDLFRSDWGGRWGLESQRQLDAVLDRAARIASIPGFLQHEAAWCGHHVRATALGASLLTAQRLGCSWRLLHVNVSADAIRCRPTAAIDDIAGRLPEALARSGYQDRSLLAGASPQRRMVGIIFADFVGFRRVPDSEMPRFWRDVMGTMNTFLQRWGERVLFSATWGDALHVVTADAVTAAEIAADIRESSEARRLRADGPLSLLDLRVAAHFAPAFEDTDPMRGGSIFYGSQLSFAARIEPVTPPGAIFGSEAFVARLMMESPGRYLADYVGEIELAKNFGLHPIFALRRREA